MAWRSRCMTFSLACETVSCTPASLSTTFWRIRSERLSIGFLTTDYGLWTFFFSFYISLDLICLIAFYESDLLCSFYLSSRLTSYVNG